MTHLKAIAPNHYRILAVPFGGPIGGRDLDRERFTKATDIMPDLFSAWPVFWHHGNDPFGKMDNAVLAKADTSTLAMEEDGWWVDAWMSLGEKRAALVDELSKRGQTIYASTQPIQSLVRKARDGTFLRWPVAELSLTTSAQNQYAVARPMKAVLDDYTAAGITIDTSTRSLLSQLDNLDANLSATYASGELVAKSGRVLSSRNESRLRAMLVELQTAIDEMTHKEDDAETTQTV